MQGSPVSFGEIGECGGERGRMLCAELRQVLEVVVSSFVVRAALSKTYKVLRIFKDTIIDTIVFAVRANFIQLSRLSGFIYPLICSSDDLYTWLPRIARALMTLPTRGVAPKLELALVYSSYLTENYVIGQRSRAKERENI